MPSVVIHSVTVSHDCGMDTFLGFTYEEALNQLYEYVCEWWDEFVDRGVPDPQDKRGTIDRYFDNSHGQEYWDSTSQVLEWPDNIPQPIVDGHPDGDALNRLS